MASLDIKVCAYLLSLRALSLPEELLFITEPTCYLATFERCLYRLNRFGIQQSNSSICCFLKVTVQTLPKTSLSGPSCSKLTTSLVNDSLKFTLSDTQIC